MSWPRRELVAATASFITFFLYLPALRNGFVNWDDGKYIFENPHIRSFDGEFFRWAFLSFHASNWHPLTWISHAYDYSMWGLNPAGHHLSSIVLHSLNTFLVTVIAVRLFQLSNVGRARPGEEGTGNSREHTYLPAIVTGLLFGMHPLHVESVAWISERKDVLCAFFFLLSIASYIGYVLAGYRCEQVPSLSRRVLGGKYLASLTFFVLALLSKPMAVTLPFVLLLIDWYPMGRFGKDKPTTIVLEKIPFFVFSVASSIITLNAQDTAQKILMPLNSLVFPLSTRIAASFYVIYAYLAKMLLPIRLIPFYPFPGDISLHSAKFLAPMLLFAVVTVYCFLISRKQQIWAVVWLYFLVTLLPVLGVVKVGDQLMADRYTYLPSIGPFLLFGTGISMLDKKMRLGIRQSSISRGVSISIVVVLCIYLSYFTTGQIGIWKDAKTLWSHEIKYEQNFSVAYDSLGDAMLREGKLFDAASLFERALQLDPVNMVARDGYTKALNALSVEALDNKDYDEALLYLSRAAQISPKSEIVLNTTGELYFAKKEYKKALDYFFSAIAINPGTPASYYNAALALENLGKKDQACKYWNAYLLRGKNSKDTDEILFHMMKLKCRKA